MAFRIGQEIVCVDDSGFSWLQRRYAALPIKGQVYRVRSFTSDGAVRLVGLINTHFFAYDTRRCDPGFDPARFRPAVKRPNDGEAFVEQLKRHCIPSPTKTREREDAE